MSSLAVLDLQDPIKEHLFVHSELVKQKIKLSIYEDA